MDLLIKDCYAAPQRWEGQTIRISGWVRTTRSSKSFGFMEVNDGSYFKNVQIVIEKGQTQEFEQAISHGTGSSVWVEGEFVLTPHAQQPFEIRASEIHCEGRSAPDYPLQKKRHSPEYLRTIAHLRPRANLFQAVFRLRSHLAQGIHRFFSERGFVYVHTPIITGSDCEGAGEMFRVTTLDPKNPLLTFEGQPDYHRDFFGKETNLTVSGQLSVETFCMAFRNVYTFGPTFRAENSNTPRHASEFWMIEPEMAFADLNDDMGLAREMIQYLIGYALEQAPEEMEFLNQFVDKTLLDRLLAVQHAEFEQISYTQAVEILQKCGQRFEYPVVWGSDLQTEHERYLTETVFGRPVFVTDYPKDIKAFYMRLNPDGRTVAAMDLLVPGVGEIIGGSQREERLDMLLGRMEQLSLCPEDYWWYLDLRKYGSVRHCGFGLGFERLIMYMSGVQNIRDVIPFPRTVGNAEF
ncbi:MAG: asparagine--tRNA ligase [Christensenellales bacterium]